MGPAIVSRWCSWVAHISTMFFFKWGQIPGPLWEKYDVSQSTSVSNQPDFFPFIKSYWVGLVFSPMSVQKWGMFLPPDEEVAAACSCSDSMNSWHFWFPNQLCMFFLAFPDKILTPKSQCTWGPLWNKKCL